MGFMDYREYKKYTNYRTRIASAVSSFELSCIWEEVRDAFFQQEVDQQRDVREKISRNY